MGNSINNFIELLTQGDFFLIFLIVMMLIIIGVIVYLVRLQINDTDDYDDAVDEEEYKEQFEPYSEEKLKTTTLEDKDVRTSSMSMSVDASHENISKDIEDLDNDTIMLDKEVDDLVNEEFVFSSSLEEEKEPVNSSPLRHIEQSRFNFEAEDINAGIDSIKNYEKEQEESAIISASELEKRLKEMRLNGQMESHEKEIQKYEEEQETKAIISYEELLERASQGSISYESEENIGGLKVSKVDTSQIESYSEINDKPYYREEAFLEAMKEFRRAL